MFSKSLAQDPIAFAMYTLHDGTLKLTAQLRAQANGYSPQVQLEIQSNNQWVQVAQTNIVNPGWTAPFRVENWNGSADVSYRVVYGNANYTGVIRKDPVDKEKFVVAAFTGNSYKSSTCDYCPGGGGGEISKQDIIDNVKKHAPDFLVFTGDQVYPHSNHFQWWIDEFGVPFGDLMRDIPSICLPDDHDVGQGNLFGESGIAGSGINGYNNGGYVKSAAYVQEVERAQTSHLPDPFDPTPVARGIGVYYTAMTYGGVSFAIIEDRKFKTGPQGLIPPSSYATTGRPDHFNDPTLDVSVLDVPQAILLGDRQLNFLEAWSQDWKNAEMKSVVSATIFTGLAHLHGGLQGTGWADGYVIADLDANGWPQTGRNKALSKIRKGFAFMIAGDQHLGSIVQHGVDDWGDAGFSFCVPSIANLYPRFWLPPAAGANPQAGMPTYIGMDVLHVGSQNHSITGDYQDGFKNKISVWAVANPRVTNREPKKLHDLSPGYGIITFDKTTRKITMEAWARYVDPRAPGALPYEGWPLTIDQEDNYGKNAVEYLPNLNVSGMTDPVVQVINEQTQEVEYTLRINGTTYRPKVFTPGNYTVKVGEFGTSDTVQLTGIRSLPGNVDSTLNINFGSPIQKRNVVLSNKDPKVSWMKKTGQVHLTLYSQTIFLVDILNVKGEILIARKIKGPGNFSMSIPKISTGVYTIKLTGEKKSFSKKVQVIQ